MSLAVIFSFESNTVYKDKINNLVHAASQLSGNTGPGTNLSDLGESLFALVNEKLWPINQMCTDLILWRG